MVAKNDVVKAAHAIDEALQAFVHRGASAKVFVFETEGGHLRALVGSDGFRNMNVVERQELVWKWMRERVDPEHLVFLYGVHPMDVEEYDARTHEV